MIPYKLKCTLNKVKVANNMKENETNYNGKYTLKNVMLN